MMLNFWIISTINDSMQKKPIITIDVMIESKNYIQENLYNLMKASYNLKDFCFNSSSNITPDSKAKVIAFEEKIIYIKKKMIAFEVKKKVILRVEI